LDEKRRKKGKTQITRRQNKRKKEVTLTKDFDGFMSRAMKRTGKTEGEIINELFKDGFAVIEFDETVGKASLVFQSWEGVSTPKAEITPLKGKTLQEYRSLRKNFPPVTAGIEWYKAFSCGGGHTVQIDDPKDKHKQEMRDEIQRMEREVYQDQYTVGFDNILDIMLDIALTEGMDAAEICYEKEVIFNDYVDDIETVPVPTDPNKTIKVPVPHEMTSDDWKKLGGITRLKIIEKAVERLRFYRHPISGEVLYITLDEKGKDDALVYDTRRKKGVIKYHPWELFLLINNRQGTNLKGTSIIQAVYTIAKLVQQIQTAVGKGYKRWSDRKYFFICGDAKRPWSKVHIKNFLTAMEQMLKKNWVGIPVPSGFDIKDIGGEQAVFEGKNILDYLTTQIAVGMQYPKDFLESGRTQASDKGWLAWRVRYGRNQLQIRRAVEHQLWEKHLFCKFGTNYRVSKKGVPIADQERRPIYVPKMEWRSEGKWHQEKEVEMLSNIMNWANPADPPLKLGVEKNLADILGMGDLDWETINELFNVKGEIRLVDAKRELIEAKARLKFTKELGVDELAKQLQRKAEEAKAREQAKEPVKIPTEELERRQQERLEGGVSRTTKEPKTKKGVARETGGTREPKRVAETIPIIEETDAKLVKKKKELIEKIEDKIKEMDEDEE